MVYLGRTATVAFPKTFVHLVDAYLDEKTEVNLCNLCSISTECSEHGTDPDRLHVATAVHKGCFVIARQSCPLAPRLTCERIWELAVARNPWPHGFQPPKSLSLESPYLMSPQAVNQVASIISIPQLKNFPSELVERIRSYSPGDTPFWRAVAALTVASSLPDLPVFAEQRVKIRHILHWKRGGQIVTVGPRGQDDVLRLTFDVDGIREIERFCQRLQCEERQKHNRRFAYVLLGTKRDELALDKKHGEFSRRFAYCRNGLLRLAFDADDIYFDNKHEVLLPFLPRIWNTPTPPDLTNCNYLYHEECFKVFSTGYYISLDSISGLTFVYRGKELVAIHPRRGDDVEMNCPKVPSSSSPKIQEACFFLPVSKEDTILGIGVGIYQNAFVVVVKKRLSGDSVIGLPCPDPPRDDPRWEGPDEDEGDFFDKEEFFWGQRNPIALVYGIPGKKKYVDMLAGYRSTPPAKPKWEGWTGTIPHLWPSGLFSLDDDADLRFYTRAPLRGVVAAQMFYYPSRRNRPTERVCSGIIFHYDNGGSRVVGEIRLENRAKLAGETIINPKLICLECDILPGFDTPNIHLVTESEVESGAHPDDWGWSFDDCPRFPGMAFTCHPMRGTINWWFTARQRNSIEIYEWAED
ncbi:uncharacterized protein NCU06320 [Neurospora crassa OR74A]|nr:uncharacterized protein NCU06320 [Neurospora crassa OR74A]XP_011394163.1 uncharacterized protein NCU06320 [Neurospora crassa OR74A]ESA42921.1 hypothetical protein, variant 1 [Neurospora crassa OR74A]ESA42922.1 hypothetical protein, variant 2 [Neurospora crassa OR74A]|eukprot:XP_011394161.1 uncharacterized protein NCU06320 [Neurospora crassa OR74A]